MMDELDEDEAKALLEEMKDSVVRNFVMPEGGQHGKGFEVVAREIRNEKDAEDRFRIDLYRGKADYDKHSVNAHVLGGNWVLMRLCVRGTKHTNPDGNVISGSHLHVYKPGFGMRYAVPVDITASSFVDDTLLLLRKFNVVRMPNLTDGLLP